MVLCITLWEIYKFKSRQVTNAEHLGQCCVCVKWNFLTSIEYWGITFKLYISSQINQTPHFQTIIFCFLIQKIEKGTQRSMWVANVKLYAINPCGLLDNDNADMKVWQDSSP
jgi:hypothetical protein